MAPRTSLWSIAAFGAVRSSIHRLTPRIKRRLDGRFLTLGPPDGIVEALQGCSAADASRRAEIIPAVPDPDNAGEGNESCVLTADVSRRTAIAPPGRRAVFVFDVVMTMAGQSSTRGDRVAVIGGGIIGLSLGWQLARRGRPVTVFERDTAGRAASWVAAGMLAPVSEFGFENEDFLEFGRRSMDLFPRFLDELAEDSGRNVPLDTRGTLVVGFHRDDTERIRRIFDFREHKGLPVQWLTGAGAREMEPLLSPRASAAMWIPEDHQIDNRRVVDALREALVGVGGELLEQTRVRSILARDGRCTGVVTDQGEHAAGVTVLAAGCWSGGIGGIPKELVPKVRPVKGQIVSLLADSTYEFARVIRAPDAYILPKGDGRLLIGATEEEMGFDNAPTAGPVMHLIERAWEAMPAIYDLPIESIDAGLRPGTRDHEPLIGESGMEGLMFATGHYRHGILLAPITALALCEVIIDGNTPEWLTPFAPQRFGG